MSREELKKKYNDLEDHVLTLLIQFIAPHLDPLQKPDDYNLDVHSFCILCHAAFEEFLEDITLFSVDTIEKEFTNKPRKFSYATLCLLHFDEYPKSKLGENTSPFVFNEYITERIKARKADLSRYAIQENHGIDVKYLRKILLPIGIEVPNSPTETSALTQLKEIRGAYAHSYARHNKPLSPEDAMNIVLDVLQMIKRIMNKALNMSYYIV